MTKPVIKIGVVSDVVCPWCYIGKRRLEQAMALAGDRFDFEVEYFPFELNPQMPEEGAGYREYLTRKFGGDERFVQLTAHVKQVAAQEGLGFNMDLQQKTPNTRNAHRVILIARDEGRQVEVVEALFKAYFTDGVDLTDNGNLLNIAVQSGLDRDKVKALLESDTGKLEIEMAEKELQELGITGVPFYIIDNRVAVSGAQAVDAFVSAFEEASDEVKETSAACKVEEPNC